MEQRSIVELADDTELAEQSSQKLSVEMDSYANRGLKLLWEIATNPAHPQHSKYGYEALREIVRLCIPKRKEGTTESGNVEISLANMFHGDSLATDVTIDRKSKPKKLVDSKAEDIEVS